MTVKSILPYGLRAIPRMKDPARYEARSFTDSDFMELHSSEKIDVGMQYPILGMKNAETKCLMRREAAERLYAAARNLPEGYRFRIWDAWRPFALQHELYEVYSKDVIRYFRLENVSEEERNAVIRGFVSDPIPDHEVPPVHTTGGAIDLTILDDHGCELDMGTGFDAFTELTRTDYFENDARLDLVRDAKGSLRFDAGQGTRGVSAENGAEMSMERALQIRDNRRLLFGIMTEAGFTNLPSEWWHFDYGDRFWAFYNEKSAIYGGVFTKEEIGGYGQFFEG